MNPSGFVKGLFFFCFSVLLDYFFIFFFGLMVFDFTVLRLNEEVILLSAGTIVFFILSYKFVNSLIASLFRSRAFEIFIYFFECFSLRIMMLASKIWFLRLCLNNLFILKKFSLFFFSNLLIQISVYDLMLRQLMKAFFLNIFSSVLNSNLYNRFSLLNLHNYLFINFDRLFSYFLTFFICCFSRSKFLIKRMKFFQNSSSVSFLNCLNQYLYM